MKLDRDGDSRVEVAGAGRGGDTAEGVVAVAGGGFGGELTAEGRSRCRRRGEGEEEKDESVSAKERSLADRGGPRGFPLSPAPPGRTQLAGFGLGRRIKNGPNPAKNEALGGRWGGDYGKNGPPASKRGPGGLSGGRLELLLAVEIASQGRYSPFNINKPLNSRFFNFGRLCADRRIHCRSL